MYVYLTNNNFNVFSIIRNEYGFGINSASLYRWIGEQWIEIAEENRTMGIIHLMNPNIHIHMK